MNCVLQEIHRFQRFVAYSRKSGKSNLPHFCVSRWPIFSRFSKLQRLCLLSIVCACLRPKHSQLRSPLFFFGRFRHIYSLVLSNIRPKGLFPRVCRISHDTIYIYSRHLGGRSIKYHLSTFVSTKFHKSTERKKRT